MKQAKASVQEAETLLRWLQKMDDNKFRRPEFAPPAFSRTVLGYLLMLEHCADPEKDFLDFKPGTSPDEIAALKARITELRTERIDALGSLHIEQQAHLATQRALVQAMDMLAEAAVAMIPGAYPPAPNRRATLQKINETIGDIIDRGRAARAAVAQADDALPAPKPSRPACFNDLDPAKAEQRGCASCAHRKDCLPF